MGFKRIAISLILVLGIALSVVPAAIAQSVYSFKMTCKGNQPVAIEGAATTTWNWTVNGAFMNGGFTSCNTSGGGFTVTGSGTVPSNANGITASMSIHRANCFKTVSTSQSFMPGGKVSITLKASCTGFKAGVGSLTIDASFTLKN
jgi:hypothetical protein